MRLKTARELGMRLKEAREDLGITQDQLAERIGTSRRWVWDLERGKETLHLGLVLRAILALGLRLDVGPSVPGQGPADTPELDGVLGRLRDRRS
jgi:y4mF family transcriptional regulator